ncbi:MAG: hypothetical protein DRI69_00210 [Bacteroidetes bacterium]|nr:MAG: hypothetical protein DRI69_00210 [Bacteroidota bacterium]
MQNISRRKWLQKSLLASTAVLIGSRALAFDFGETPTSTYAFKELLRLNWNENPYGPSQSALEAATKALKSANRYPDALNNKLIEAIATKLGVKNEEVMITAGSTEVLSLLGQHAGLLSGEIVTPWPSFPTMMHFGKVSGASVKHVPLDNEDRLDLNAVLKSIGPNTRLLFICNPNNPTSTEVDPESLRSFCRSVPENVLICVDEAYIEFSSHGAKASMMPLVKELPNLIVCRTFSKAYGLAGMRLGYAVSQNINISELSKRHNGYGMATSVASVAGALAALEDPGFIKMCVTENAKGRQILYDAFDQWKVAYNKSSTNFVYARAEHFVPDVVEKLSEQNVMITKWPIMKNHIRISIGKPEHMSQFVQIVESFLS